MQPDVFVAPLELKFAEAGADGTFSGYGAVFGNIDSHGDLILPGAFAESLAERKAQGRGVPMHVMHGVYGGDGVPVGIWTKVEEDEHGLRVEGKLSGMNTDVGRMRYELVKDGALSGLSIGYRIKKNGAVYGQKAGDPKRTLKALHLGEISLVDDPSNAMARVTEMKRLARVEMKAAVLTDPDTATAADRIEAAIRLQDGFMASYFFGSSGKDGALLMDALRDAYEALTGSRAPDGLMGWTKGAITEREVKAWLREEFGLSHTQAGAMAGRLFKASPRDEGRDQADQTEAHTMLADLGSSLAGFKLP
ncbi:HK97 family phage prohead protease [Methylorubrum salsuginis]|uniref:Prohead serine protease domain-containing protein n=1 Tax=Methylorubrum salsuginis TaxID=414703 RepID=A0A1I4FKD8_9HYPH|nr:HK97 family phage prohead protease [Methylorubrum salsuginis]SFL18372.1 hypothetical protein SAMN04488125_11088 [Methylorubrum salsuginis]